MLSILMLVVALQSGGWQCSQVGALWRCESTVKILPAPTVAPETPTVVAAPPVAPETPTVVVAPPEEEASDSDTPVERRTPPADALAAGVADAVSGYVVQIGAYRDRQQAEEAARRIDRDGLFVMPTEKAGEEWFVLLLGAFPTLDEARAAGDAYQQAFPRGSYWVRSAENLRRVLKS